MSRRNPFDEIERMFDRMNRQLEGAADGPFGGGMGSVSVDVADRDDEFAVTADLPGFETEDIDLSIDGRTVHISADREESREEGEEGTFLRQERRRRSVSRSVTLPDDVEEDGASATYRNGVLTVTLPKRRADDDSKSIDIS